jgi:hypothetical protein
MDEVDLRDKHIVDARYDDNTDTIHLNLENGYVSLTPYGDCCANCFIQHVDNADALQDAIVNNVQDLDTELLSIDDDFDYEGSCVNSWGHRILTNKGICTIEMRVIHNGYYGGSLDAKMNDGKSYHELLEDF